MVRKATTKAVATKKVSKAKAAPKARPPVQYSTATIQVPEGKLTLDQATEFLRKNLKPLYGKLSNSINEHNRGTREQIDLFFMKYPDADRTGVYGLQRPHAGNTIFLHQVVQGRSEAVLGLNIDVVRRGPKSIEYIHSAVHSAPSRFTHQLAQGVDDQVREQVETLVGQRDATTEPTENRRELPNLFHHDYQRLTRWLQDFTTESSVADMIKAQIASLVKASITGGVVTEDMMGQVVFTTARMAGPTFGAVERGGRVQLQMFTADHAAAKPPFGVIDLVTNYQTDPASSITWERVSEVTGVRQNPLGAAPAYQMPGGWGGGWKGAARSRWGAAAESAYGEHPTGRQAPVPGMAAWTPHGPLFGGQRPFGAPGFGGHAGGKPETFDVTTSSLTRFTAQLNVLVDEVHELVDKQYVDQLKNKVHAMFYNQAASQQGSLLFDFKFMSGHSLLVIVRDRTTQLTHFIETIQLS
jgi:hypothetical protein